MEKITMVLMDTWAEKFDEKTVPIAEAKRLHRLGKDCDGRFWASSTYYVERLCQFDSFEMNRKHEAEAGELEG